MLNVRRPESGEYPPRGGNFVRTDFGFSSGLVSGQSEIFQLFIRETPVELKSRRQELALP
jgi:hypothetical protein